MTNKTFEITKRIGVVAYVFVYTMIIIFSVVMISEEINSGLYFMIFIVATLIIESVRVALEYIIKGRAGISVRRIRNVIIFVVVVMSVLYLVSAWTKNQVTNTVNRIPKNSQTITREQPVTTDYGQVARQFGGREVMSENEPH